MIIINVDFYLYLIFLPMLVILLFFNKKTPQRISNMEKKDEKDVAKYKMKYFLDLLKEYRRAGR